jgi:hypothetical protein
VNPEAALVHIGNQKWFSGSIVPRAYPWSNDHSDTVIRLQESMPTRGSLHVFRVQHPPGTLN